MPFDRDLVPESFIEFASENGWDEEDIEYFRQEPEACFQQAQLFLIEGIVGQIERSAGLLGQHYPFDVSDINNGVLRLIEEPTPVGRAYLWLQVYLLRVSSHNYLQFQRDKPWYPPACKLGLFR